MDEITVTFTRQEAQALQQFIHMAVMSRGMQVAEAAVVVNKKLEAALAPPPSGNGYGIAKEA